MSDVSADINTTASVTNGRYSGQFETEGDVDWVAVDLVAGTTYTLRGLGSDSDNGTAQYVRISGIFDATGAEVAHNPEEHYTLRQASDYFTTEAQTAFTPTQSGTYYVEVDSWGIDIGSYTLFVTEDQLGGDADESLVGSAGIDSILGGRGNDTVEGLGGDDFLDGEWGDDVLTGGAGADIFTFYSDNWDDIRDGEADLWGDDTITDFNPAEDLIHFAGRIVSGLDDLTVTAEGDNTVLTAAWGDSVTLVGVSADQLSDENFKFRLGVRIEGGNLEGGDGDDTLTGSDSDDIIYGFGGDDVLSGGGGDDYLRGFAGDDTIEGGDGSDIIGGEEGNNVISGGDGDDFIIAHGGNDSVAGDGGNDLIETRGGDDTLSGGAGGDTLRPGQGDDVISAGGGADIIVIGRDWGHDVIEDFDLSADILDFQGSGLDLDDLTISSDGGNTVLSSGDNSLTLEGVAQADFEAVASDIVLGAGSVTSFYGDFSETDLAADPTSEVLTTTGVINDFGERWQADADGITRVSYSFLSDTSLPYIANPGDDSWWFDASEAVTPLVQFTVEAEIRRIESFTNLDLVWVEDTGESGGNIRLGFHEFVIGGASTIPYEGPYAADVFVGIHVGEEFHAGFFIHELGHSLGFDDLPEWNALTGRDYTIMSYVLSARYPDAEHASTHTESYQWADIAGLQYLYGIDTESTAGATKFEFDLAEAALTTIFDAGGTDTISVTGTGDPVMISLIAGTWSDIGPDIVYSGGGQDTVETGTVFIMPGTVIENASGSTGDDVLIGNASANILRGMDGDDTVEAGAGDDTIWAGAGDQGDDLVFGEAGRDELAGGAGNDLLVGGDDRDVIFGGSGDDMVILGLWSDANADGQAQASEITSTQTSTDLGYGGTGNDTVIGTGGANELGGGEGSDSVEAAGGDDIVYGGRGQGADTLLGGAGGDTIFGGAGDDSLLGGAGDDLLFSGAGADTVNGGAGSDTIWGGGGDDLFTGGSGADVFAFGTAHGFDTITDFDVSEDILDVQSAGFADFDAFIDSATMVSNGVLIAFANTEILLLGATLTGLESATVLI